MNSLVSPAPPLPFFRLRSPQFLLAALMVASCGSSGSEDETPVGTGGAFLVTISDRDTPGTLAPFVTYLSSGETQSLAAHVPGSQSVVSETIQLSPDGRYLAFFSTSDFGVSSAGVVVDLENQTASTPFQGANLNLDGPTEGDGNPIHFWFSPNSAHVVMEVASVGVTTLMDADGSNPRELMHGMNPITPIGWMPDSTAFVAVVEGNSSITSEILLAGVGSTADQVIDPLPGEVAFIREVEIGEGGGTIAGVLRPNPTQSLPKLFGIDVPTGSATVFAIDDVDVDRVRISDSGRRIAATSNSSQELHVCGMDSGFCESLTPLPLQGDMTTSWFEWEPGTERLAFLGNFTSGSDDVYLWEENQPTVRISTEQVGDASHPEWSPVGGAITFMHDGGTVRGLYLYDTSLAAPLRLVDTEIRVDGMSPVSWSPMGDWFYANRDLPNFDSALTAFPVDGQQAAVNIGPVSVGQTQPGTEEPRRLSFGATSGIAAWRGFFEPTQGGASAIGLFTATPNGSTHGLALQRFSAGGDAIEAFALQD